MRKDFLFGLIGGSMFAIGLVFSGMTKPNLIIDFLDVMGKWNPQLAFVLGGAVATTLLLFPLVLRQKKPLVGEKFILPSKTNIDARLGWGAAIFGLGWGVAGYCPAPALANLLWLDGATCLFLVGLVVGSLTVKNR